MKIVRVVSQYNSSILHKHSLCVFFDSKASFIFTHETNKKRTIIYGCAQPSNDRSLETGVNFGYRHNPVVQPLKYRPPWPVLMQRFHYNPLWWQTKKETWRNKFRLKSVGFPSKHDTSKIERIYNFVFCKIVKNYPSHNCVSLCFVSVCSVQ